MRTQIRRRKLRRDERGAMLIIAMITLVVVAALGMSYVGILSYKAKEVEVSLDSLSAFYLAEAGLSEAVAKARVAALLPLPLHDGDSFTIVPIQTFYVGNPATEVVGTYVVQATYNGEQDCLRIVSTGTYHQHARFDSTRKLEIQIKGTAISPPFLCAVFAGNSSGEPGYTLDFGGGTGHSDYVWGNIYSGGDIAVRAQALIEGGAMSPGRIQANPGAITGEEEKDTLPNPDIAGMNYEYWANRVDVAAEFAAHQVNGTRSWGGTAKEVQDENNAAHIFRKNPSDRATECGTTTKNDYFLEDYNQALVAGDPSSYGQTVTLAPTGNDLLYYIDGDLWIHNKNTYGFALGATGGARVTIVVNGNLHISDNVFLEDAANGGIAFIATKDPAVADSGNVYIGDPVFGTVQHLNCYMFAEGNFFDENLDEDGSQVFDVTGNMTAGNQVMIQREYKWTDYIYVCKYCGRSSSSKYCSYCKRNSCSKQQVTGYKHSEMSVYYDPRISDGRLALIGIPRAQVTLTPFDQIVSYRELEPNEE